MNIESWLQQVSDVTVDEDPVSSVKLLDAQDQCWMTWAMPVGSERIITFINEMKTDLPTGRHTMSLVAISSSGDTRARMNTTVDGNSTAAKAAHEQHITHAKAIAMNVETAARQLDGMNRIVDAANNRAANAEERVAELTELSFELLGKLKDYSMKEEMTSLELEEKRMRVESLKNLYEQAAPLIGFLVPHILKSVEARFSGALPPSAGAAQVAAPSPPLPLSAPEQAPAPDVSPPAPQPELPAAPAAPEPPSDAALALQGENPEPDHVLAPKKARKKPAEAPTKKPRARAKK